MSKERRKKLYEKLVKAGQLWRDDGALVKEFNDGEIPKGYVENNPNKPAAPEKKGKK